MIHKYIATCPTEIQTVLCQELEKAGAQEITREFKAVRFSCEASLGLALHMQLSTASRLLRILRESSASNLAIITDQARRIPWEEIFQANSTYLVEGVAGDRGPKALSSTQISKAVRLGIEARMQRRGLALPKVNLKEPSFKVVAFVHDRKLTVSLDSSGKTLHKRGYRQDGHPAPLKETLAASLIKLMGYDGTQVFLDPMCGSGTLAIEACYQALHKAPLIHRRKGQFGFEHFADFDAKQWRMVQETVRKQRLSEPEAAIYASDLSKSYVELARENALKARVEKHINFSSESFFDRKAPAPSGMILSNLPYGERLQAHEDLDFKDFYKKIGDHLKAHFQGWTAGFLVANDSPHKFIGLKPKRKIPILNGSIPCKLLIFEIFAGKHKEKVSAKHASGDTPRKPPLPPKPKDLKNS